MLPKYGLFALFQNERHQSSHLSKLTERAWETLVFLFHVLLEIEERLIVTANSLFLEDASYENSSGKYSKTSLQSILHLFLCIKV